MLAKIFTDIYETNAWGSQETVSGGGSELARTKEIRSKLNRLLGKYKTESILDAGCGDWNWMSKVNLSRYKVFACDIVPALIKENEKKYGSQAKFFTADITRDPLPKVDVIICRATLFHLSLANVQLALENMQRSAGYLLLTTHTQVTENTDIQDGDWRRLNMELPPFTLGSCLQQFYDGPGEDGSMGVWEVE